MSRAFVKLALARWNRGCFRARRLERTLRREFATGRRVHRAPIERLTIARLVETAILMISPPARRTGPSLRFGKPYAAIAKLSPDIRAFIADRRRDCVRLGYSAPARLCAYSIDEGLALIEDLGSTRSIAAK